MFIHDLDNWTDFKWDADTLNSLQLKTMHRLGYLGGRMAAIGFDNQLVASVEAVTNDVVSSFEIEGVRLDTEEVRSSVARKLGVKLPHSKDSTHYVDGIVEMMLDASRNYNTPLDQNRLFRWHTTLFPFKTDMTVGAYSSDEMSVVSGTFGRERIHYRAPSPERVKEEMDGFLYWLNADNGIPAILKAAIAHLWFVCIHPFDDGNGRIARAISDMILASLDGDSMHFYSLSRQILKDKNHYYKVLERTQRGDGNITEWLIWFLNAIIAAVEDSNEMLSHVLRKATFWNNHAESSITQRQRMVLNRYLDGYEAKLTAKNWQKIASVSKDTALRDIAALVDKGILIPTPGRVRDISYSISCADNPDKTPFRNISIETDGDRQYICATLGSSSLRDRITSTDAQRLADGEVTLADMAYKYFAYALE